VCTLALGGRRVRRRGTWRTRGARERHQRFEPRGERGADPFDASQVRQRAKWPALFAVGDNPPGHHRADPWQQVQLRRRRDIDVDLGARQHRSCVAVRRRRRVGRSEAGQSVRRQVMAPASPSRFRFTPPLLRSARGIDRDQLAIQRARVGSGNGIDRPYRAQCAHRCAEETDAGQEEEGFLFGRCWHTPSVLALPRMHASNRCAPDR
jgi:hypothetical protein